MSSLLLTTISNKEDKIGGHPDINLSTENVTTHRALISFLLHEQYIIVSPVITNNL